MLCGAALKVGSNQGISSSGTPNQSARISWVERRANRPHMMRSEYVLECRMRQCPFLCEREIRRVIFPGVEDGGSAVRDVDNVASGQIEIVLDRCRGQQRIDDRGRVTGKTLDRAADRAPAQRDLIRDGENTSGKAALQRLNRSRKLRTPDISRRQVLDAFVILRDGENAEIEQMLGL